MRKLMFALGAVAFTGAGYLSACSSSSSDDSSVNSDGGMDASPDNYVPFDSGPAVDSGSDAGCETCFTAIQEGPYNLCADNGPPSSLDIFKVVQACECSTDGGCGVACAANCSDVTTAPTSDCIACINTSCAAEQAACVNDDGSDAGPPVDAGDGGDGG